MNEFPSTPPNWLEIKNVVRDAEGNIAQIITTRVPPPPAPQAPEPKRREGRRAYTPDAREGPNYRT